MISYDHMISYQTDKFVCHDNDIICISTHKRFCMSVKGHNFVNKHCRVMILSQSVALMMVNKCMKFHEICFSTFKVKAKVMSGKRHHLHTDTQSFVYL